MSIFHHANVIAILIYGIICYSLQKRPCKFRELYIKTDVLNLTRPHICPYFIVPVSLYTVSPLWNLRQHLLRIFCCLHLIICHNDHTLFINQIGGSHYTHRYLSIILFLFPDIICLDCFQFWIREQRKSQPLLFFKSLMRCNTIKSIHIVCFSRARLELKKVKLNRLHFLHRNTTSRPNEKNWIVSGIRV